ncbi:50S ribosomal protein L32 [Candidatus Poriferisodalis sp.]|uniref:50S ribosomal protein L32 n=1 Tax=Candidatus Poriferisodalis sp. TaxID=3101277 RepID=UPI003B0290DB
MVRSRSRSDRGARTVAVPKKKTSKSKTRSRRAAAWRLAEAPRSLCPRCGAAKLPHRVCGQCGWYGGRQALDIA